MASSCCDANAAHDRERRFRFRSTRRRHKMRSRRRPPPIIRFAVAAALSGVLLSSYQSTLSIRMPAPSPNPSFLLIDRGTCTFIRDSGPQMFALPDGVNGSEYVFDQVHTYGPVQVSRGHREIPGRAVRWGQNLQIEFSVIPIAVTADCIFIWAAAAYIRYVKDQRRRRRSGKVCAKCGYDLRASVDRCPECGRAIAMDGQTDETIVARSHRAGGGQHQHVQT